MKNIKKFCAAFIVCSICTFLIAWARGVFEQTAPIYIYHILSDSFLVVGIVTTCIALLLFVGNEGTFDMISYGLQIFFSFFKKDMARRYETFYDYRVAKQERKLPFLFLLVCGGLFLFLSMLMYVGYCKYL